MPYTLHHKEFSGPLDILLELVEREEKEITDVALSEVTEDFLKYLDEHESITPEELADFLVIAAKLLLLKSHALLPSPSSVESDDIPLADQLRLYKLFVDASVDIAQQWNQMRISYGRVIKIEVKHGFYPPQHISTEVLCSLFAGIMNRLEFFQKLPERALERVVSLREKIEIVRNILKKGTSATLQAVLGSASSKADLIVTFLALLELVKQKEVLLQQKSLFGDIHIHS